MNAIEIKDLCKSYGEFEIDSLNLALPCGCIMGLVGENGAGKTTTLKLILDMVRRDKGTIKIFGKDNRDNSALKEDIGVVPDEVGLPSCLTPRQVNKIMKHTFKNWDEATFFGYIEKLNVPDKQFKDLSRGMKMKLGIAISLSHKAKLLILDEATSGLDPVVRDEVLNIFNEFTRDETHSVLISSHVVSDLEKICDYIAFMRKGKLILCEEKDLLKEEFVVVHCSESTLETLDAAAIVGKRKNAYGVEAICRKNYLPRDLDTTPVDLEQLFIFMSKEEV